MEPRGERWVAAYRALGSLMYDGTAGIGLFLARLASLTNDPIIRTTAEGALAQALTAVDALTGAGEYGFYSGLSGIAWACRAAGRLIGHEALAARGEAVLLAVAQIAPNPQRIDVINGSAGLIPVLIEAATGDQCDELLVSAMRHGEHLLDLAERGENGWSMPSVARPRATPTQPSRDRGTEF